MMYNVPNDACISDVSQLLFERYDFFPLNRALSLSAMDEDSTESKVDDLLKHVMMLVERQREEVSLPCGCQKKHFSAQRYKWVE